MLHTPSPPHDYDDDEIDLRELISVLWRQKRLIITVAGVGAIVGLLVSGFSTLYVTDSLFLTPNLTVVDYKRLDNLIQSGASLRQFLQSANQAKSTAGELLHELSSEKEALGKVFTPEFAYNDKDQKLFGVKLAEKDQPNTITGVRITLRNTQPTEGAPSLLLAEFIRDSLIRFNLGQSMLVNCSQYRTREQELRNDQLNSVFSITQEEQRAANLRSIISRNPGGASSTSQIVSLEKGTERYLSPAAQLTASEIQIADMKLAEVRRERDRVSSALKRDYYCQAQQALQQPITGRNFLEGLQNILTDTFQGQDKSKDIIEKTWNELDVERQNWVSAYLQNMRFLVSPEGAEVKERKPSLRLGLLLGVLLGGLLGLFGALIRNWWSTDPASTADHST